MEGVGVVRNLKLWIGLGLLVVIIVSGLAAGHLTPYDPDEQHLDLRLKPPGTPGHPLGTDPLGRDLGARVLYGSRVSLLIGLAAVVLAGGLGIPLGLAAGYRGGLVDSIVMRLVDLQLAVPFLVLALVIMAVVGPSLLNVVLVLGLAGWVAYARVVRAETLAIREREFVTAARAAGAGPWKILVRHVLPHIWPQVIVVSTLQIGTMILAEASLSFLGLGVPPEVTTWGGIAADGRDYVTSAWWVTTVPGVAILLTVLGTNLVGDWLRDRLDPTLRR